MNRITDKPTVRPTKLPKKKKKKQVLDSLHISVLDWLGNFRHGRDRKTFVLALTRELGSKFGSRRTSLSLWNNHSMGLPTCPLQHSSPLTISTSVCSCVSNTFFFVSWLLFCFFLFLSFFLFFFLSFIFLFFSPPSPFPLAALFFLYTVGYSYHVSNDRWLRTQANRAHYACMIRIDFFLNLSKQKEKKTNKKQQQQNRKTKQQKIEQEKPKK